MAFRKRSARNPPLLSPEFVLQNHADLAACMGMVCVLGLLFEGTAEASIAFLTLQHRVPAAGPEARAPPRPLYRYGARDLATVSFYALVAVLAHATLQEYVLDPVARRLQLPRARQGRFGEAGQLGAFCALSSAWGAWALAAEGGLSEPGRLWRAPPGLPMTFRVKFFYVAQLAYWCHAAAELLLQRTPRDALPPQLVYIGLHLFHVAAAYLLYLHHLGLLLLSMHYGVELLSHLRDLLALGDGARRGELPLWAALLIAGRLGTLAVSVLTACFQLAGGRARPPDAAAGGAGAGDVDVLAAEMAVLASSCTIQACVTWNMCSVQLRRWAGGHAALQAPAAKKRRTKGRASRKGTENGVAAAHRVDVPARGRRRLHSE